MDPSQRLKLFRNSRPAQKRTAKSTRADTMRLQRKNRCVQTSSSSWKGRQRPRDNWLNECRKRHQRDGAGGFLCANLLVGGYATAGGAREDLEEIAGAARKIGSA